MDDTESPIAGADAQPSSYSIDVAASDTSTVVIDGEPHTAVHGIASASEPYPTPATAIDMELGDRESARLMPSEAEYLADQFRSLSAALPLDAHSSEDDADESGEPRWLVYAYDAQHEYQELGTTMWCDAAHLLALVLLNREAIGAALAAAAVVRDSPSREEYGNDGRSILTRVREALG